MTIPQGRLKTRRNPTAGVTKKVAHALGQLTHADLVKGLDDAEPAYLFKHALVQDTVHATLLKNENKRLHLLVAHALESVNANRLDEYAPALAHHFAQAENDAKTLEYSIRAGDNAARVFANDEALAHYATAIQVAKRTAVTDAQLIYLYTRYGRILEVTGKYFEALASYEELHELAATRANRSQELASLMLRAPLHSAPLPTFNGEIAKQMLLDALGTARELGDEMAEARVLWNLCLLSVHTMHPADGIMYGELSLALAEKLDLREQCSYTLHDLFIPYCAVGQSERGYTVLAQARTLFRELDNKAMLADNLGMSAQFAMYTGRFEEALTFAIEGHQISRTIGNPFGIFFNKTFLSNVYLEYGEIAQCFEVVQEQIDQLRKGTLPFNAMWVAAILGLMFGQSGATAQSQEMEKFARAWSSKSLPPIFRQGIAALLGRIQLLRGNPEQAAQDIEGAIHDETLGGALQPGAIHMPLARAELALARGEFSDALEFLKPQEEWARANHYRMLLPENLRQQACAYRGLGEWDAAAAALQEARVHAAEIGMRRQLWQIYAALAEIETKRGNLVAADTFRAEAREYVTFMVEHTPPELRAAFLELPQVRAVMA